MSAHPDGSDGDVADELGAYAAGVTLEDVPEGTRARLGLVLLDTVGVCLRGSRADYVRGVVAARERLVGQRPAGGAGATVFATMDRRSVPIAALANAAGGTTLELDEGNQRSAHMAIHVVPPALAVAERESTSGRALLEAIVSAYEASARVGDAIRPQREGLHPHGSWAPIGGAIAAGRLLGLDAEGLATAIRIAANPFVAGHWAAALEGATVRDFYTGIACEHGVRAAVLAAGGATGVRGAIGRCLFPYTAGRDDAGARLERAIEGLGVEYYLDSSYVKVHAACRYTHAPIEALDRVLSEGEIPPERIVSIEVETFNAGGMLDERRPGNVLAAKFSTPYALAARAVLGSTGVEAFDDRHLDDPRIRRLAGAVEVRTDPAFDERAREGRWGARVVVTTEDGAAHEATVEDARGGGANPFTEAEVREKFHRLVGGEALDGRVDADELERRLDEIEDRDDVATLFEGVLG